MGFLGWFFEGEEWKNESQISRFRWVMVPRIARMMRSMSAVC